MEAYTPRLRIDKLVARKLPRQTRELPHESSSSLNADRQSVMTNIIERRPDKYVSPTRKLMWSLKNLKWHQAREELEPRTMFGFKKSPRIRSRSDTSCPLTVPSIAMHLTKILRDLERLRKTGS